jgi:hypothetical protein
MAKKIVEAYLNFFKNPIRDEQTLAPILSHDFHFKSPLGEFQTAELFLKDLKRNALGIKEIQIHHIISEGTKAGALYDVISHHDEIGTLRFSEWFETKDGQITKIISTYDTSTVHPAISRI